MDRILTNDPANFALEFLQTRHAASIERWLGKRKYNGEGVLSVDCVYRGTTVGRAEAAHDANDAPREKCTCGVYASKSLEHLRTTGYERYGICGEVNLWGTVVEHEQGFRAQFAYPKNLYLPPKMLPSTLAEIQSRLQALTLYGSDIFVIGNDETISLWGKDSGYSPAGLDYLIERSKRYYDRRRLERTLRLGDRVAILGHGIAVVEQVDNNWIQAVVWNKCELRIARKEIVWDEGNARWETDANAAFDCPVQPPE